MKEMTLVDMKSILGGMNKAELIAAIAEKAEINPPTPK